MNPKATQRKYAEMMMASGRSVNRGTWQSVKTELKTRELDDVLLTFEVPPTMAQWQMECEPDLPWAEDHFAERVSGIPMNPAPSYVDWPWHSQSARDRFMTAGNGERFDHTYPERFWPKHYKGHDYDGDRLEEQDYIRHGIHFDYGDLNDVIALLVREPFTRQAYLPIFFPEDTGSTVGQRVPCTLGYHFIRNGTQLDIKYLIRSCDITRHFLNDVYMAGRLLQHVVLHLEGARSSMPGLPHTGKLTMYISNFHLFTEDEWRYK